MTPINKDVNHIDQKPVIKEDQPTSIALFPKQICELWRYRELAIELFWTYLKLRYVGSVLGFIWTMLNPVLFIQNQNPVVTHFRYSLKNFG